MADMIGHNLLPFFQAVLHNLGTGVLVGVAGKKKVGMLEGRINLV